MQVVPVKMPVLAIAIAIIGMQLPADMEAVAVVTMETHLQTATAAST